MLGGLRGRLVAAMMLVSVLTLAVAAFALLSPIQSQFRSDQIKAMAQAVRAQRPALAQLNASDALTPRSRRLRAIGQALHRTTAADVSVYRADGTRLYATEASPDVTSAQALRALRTGREQRTTSGTEDEARVAVPLVVDHERIAVELRKPLTNVAGAARVVRNAFLLAAAISLLAALLMGVLLARRLVLRLRALRDTALRVAELGPVAEMQSDDSSDEVGDLTRALVTMQGQLREQEQARRTFVATASHELRTPLTSLRMMLDLLREDLESDTPDLVDARSQAARADAQASRLAQLAAELLDLSRIDAGVPLRSELVATGEVIRSVIAEFGVRLTESEQTVDADTDDAPWAVADPSSVAQILRVLFDNALRHAPRSGPLRVTTESRDGTVLILVSDHGPGIPDTDAEQIFGRFQRGASATGTPGVGLGLAIARELARRMRGELTVRPSLPGTGACFVLALPAAPQD